MKECKILFSWIGNTDLMAMAKPNIDEKLRQCALKTLKLDNKTINSNISDSHDTSSLILALKDSLNKESEIPVFGKIVLLTNRPSGDDDQHEFHTYYTRFIATRFKDYAGKVEVRFVDTDAYDFESVNKAVESTIKVYAKEYNPDGFWYNISPGTIAQQTSWILRGKTFSTESHFIQGSKSKRQVSPCTIPYDISAVLNAQARYIEGQEGSYTKAVGKAPSFLKCIEMARKVARFPVTVMLTGESGTGKEILARMIHENSGREKEKFLAINCATLSKGTGLTEYFGYYKGAYTGAEKGSDGKFKGLNKGTLFLDEIGECPLEIQAELLRFLQPRQGEKPTMRFWHKKGADSSGPGAESTEEQKADIRVIVATNRDISDANEFRQDLFFRLETIRIQLPTLEQRKSETSIESGIDDIKDLADYFLQEKNRYFSCQKEFSDSAYEVLRLHTWKGNVRELSNAVTRAVIFSSTNLITGDEIEYLLNKSSQTTQFKNTEAAFKHSIRLMAEEDLKKGLKKFKDRVAEFQKIYCETALEASNNNMKEAYSALEINPRSLDKYLGRTPKSKSLLS